MMTPIVFFANLLGLDGFVVVSVREEYDAYYLGIAPDNHFAVCPHCGGVCEQTRQKRTPKKQIRDLPVLDKLVFLNVQRRQFRCADCRVCFTPKIPFLAEGTWITQRLLDRAAEHIRHSDVATAARFYQLPERSLDKWYYAHVQRELEGQVAVEQPIRALGIDELSLKKRQRQFVAVIVDHTNGRVLEVLESRKKEDVKAYLEQLSRAGRLAELEEVTCDMWGAYVSAVREVFGDGVRLTVDRFHVMQQFQEQLTKARREIQRTLSAEEQKELKGSRWWWLTNAERLTANSRKALKALKRRFPQLAALHDRREVLRAIFENERLTAESARRCLLQWVTNSRALGLKALDAFCGTLERWLEEIVNYFHARRSNGRTEGFNRGLRSILWRACGMQNFGNFRLRVLHAFGLGRPATKKTNQT